MKVLKILAFLLGIIVIAGVILNYISPNEVHIHQSAEIDAEPSVVFEHLSQFEHVNKWQPWLKIDTTTKVTIKGTDGQVGAISSWVSEHKEVGVGEQEITKLEPNNRIEIAMRFKEPWVSESTGYYDLEEVDGKIKVTWGMETDVDFPVNIMMKFNRGTVEKQFAKGLGALKEICESAEPVVKQMPKAKGSYTFTNMDRPMIKYLMKRDKISMENVSVFFQTNMPQVYTAITAAGAEMAGPPSGLYFEWDEENGMVDMAVAIPVKESLEIEGFSMFEQPAGMTVKATSFGPYENGQDVHYAMDAHMKKNGYEFDKLVLEEYVNDPTTVADPSEIQTDVYYYIIKPDNM